MNSIRQKVFIPVSDELIFDRPELISAPLRPYSENLACYHWLDVRLNPEDDACIAESFGRQQASPIQDIAARFLNRLSRISAEICFSQVNITTKQH